MARPDNCPVQVPQRQHLRRVTAACGAPFFPGKAGRRRVKRYLVDPGGHQGGIKDGGVTGPGGILAMLVKSCVKDSAAARIFTRAWLSRTWSISSPLMDAGEPVRLGDNWGDIPELVPVSPVRPVECSGSQQTPRDSGLCTHLHRSA